ncbi:hypothetical protein [Carboxylicivirga sp. RSCT41]|uniref:hypothetical protein n=1 Tax=Carboxylicivirga agarovorans TaxID=3417570 RepID=UPI003D32D6AF
MKYLLLSLITLLLSTSISAQSNKRTIKLSGSINDSYAIIMTLTIQGEDVLGYYYYDKYKSKILLEGNIQGDRLVLNESPDYESDYEVGFIGELNGKTYAGVWKDKSKNKELDFNTLVYSDISANQAAHISELEGRFENIFNSDKFLASVSLYHIEDKIFCFEISNGTESGCTGYLKGLVELSDSGIGVYTGDGCEELRFSLSNNELKLIENNCDYHGLNCPFEGTYKKKEQITTGLKQ